MSYMITDEATSCDLPHDIFLEFKNCQQEPSRRKPLPTNDDLSECARKGIAGEPVEQIINMLLRVLLLYLQ